MTNRMLPLYVKIADQLRQKIFSGELAPESRLPTQRELAEAFSTTLMTVRQALEVLTEENLIRTEHGIGSFVIGPQVDENNFNLLGFSSEMSQRALPIETRLLSVRLDACNEQACQALLQPEGAQLVKLDRLRLLHGKPIVYQRSYLPGRFAEIIEAYSPETSLYQFLHQRHGLMIASTREVLKSIVLDDEQARLLQRTAGEAALLSLRVSIQQEGAPVLFDDAILAADSFVIATERIGLRTSYQFHVLDSRSPDPFTLLMENE